MSNSKDEQPGFDATVQTIIEVAVKAVVGKVVGEAFAAHEKRELENLAAHLEAFSHAAFPDGDPEPHREYHQAKINAAVAEQLAEESRKRFYDAALGKVVEKGIEGVFGVLRILTVIALLSLALKFGLAIPEWLTK